MRPDFDAAVAAIDRANSGDPRPQEAEGRTWPQEVLYSRRMSDWVSRLATGASEELRLAARAQHLCRWEVSRSTYPEGRLGYLRWRKDLKKIHADKLAAIMREAGYDDGSIDKARTLILRKETARDPEGQTLEDAACLVFLQFEVVAFAAKTDDSKVVDILRKTWAKMSPVAREAALKLDLGDRERGLVERALAAR